MAGGGNYRLNMNALAGGFERTGDLAGRAARFHYASGHTLEQHWRTDSQILWKGVGGPLAGYHQFDSYHAFKIAEGLYFLTWMEKSTTPEATADQQEGPWMTNVVLDLSTMRALASWTGPLADGGVEHVIDQATIEFVPCDRDTRCDDPGAGQV